MKQKLMFTLLLMGILLFTACSGSNPPSGVVGTNPEQTRTVTTPESTASVQMPQPTKYSTPTADPAVSPLILEVTWKENQEIISVINISETEMDISYYMVFSENANDRFLIPGGAVLKSQESFDIYNGNKNGVPDGHYWEAAKVVNNKDDQVLLLNHAGRVIYFFTYYP